MSGMFGPEVEWVQLSAELWHGTFDGVQLECVHLPMFDSWQWCANGRTGSEGDARSARCAAESACKES